MQNPHILWQCFSSFMVFRRALDVDLDHFKVPLCRVCFLADHFSVLIVFGIFALWLFLLFLGPSICILLWRISNIRKVERSVLLDTRISTTHILQLTFYHVILHLSIRHRFKCVMHFRISCQHHYTFFHMLELACHLLKFSICLQDSFEVSR